MGHLGIDSQ